KLRHPRANMTTHADGGAADIPYLRVTVPDDVRVRLYPVGVCEGEMTREVLERFLAQVDRLYRDSDPHLVSELVYRGKPVVGLVQEARRRGVRLQTFVEYQGLIDFGHYLDRQTQRLQNDPLYPSRLFVPQALRFDIGLDSRDAGAKPGAQPDGPSGGAFL